MEAVSPLVTPATEPVTEIEAVPRRERTQTLTVTATYRLSEEGRKASLLTGGDGREVQEIMLPVPTNRIHLVSVDANGHARLKLRPRYSLNADQNVIRDDDPPRFDALPTVEDLLKEAARNHQLERAYKAERAEARRKRQDRKFDVHQQIAEAFLADSTRRAHEHPRPTPRQCYLTARNRVVLFDAKRDHGVARQVPPEAYRRFCADERARTELGQGIFRREFAIHEDRERLIAEWVSTHGTADQRDRYAAGMLPMAEVLEGMADEEFAAAVDRPRYVLDGIERLQAHLQQFTQYATVVVTKRDLRVTTARAEDATETQWVLMQELRALSPHADVTLQRHRLAWARDNNAPAVTVWGVLVRRKIGPFNVRREFLAPNSDDSARERAGTPSGSMAVFDKERR
jgi:hypothetical protein